MKKKVLTFQWIALLTVASSWCYGHERDAVIIQELLAKAEKAPPVQYEIFSAAFVVGKTSPAFDSPGSKVWQKGTYRKSEMRIKGALVGTFIKGPDGSYFYMPEKDRYVKQAKNKGAAEPPQSVIKNLINNKNWKLTIIGDEIVDGKDCTIIQAVEKKDARPNVSFTVKYWIWEENGLGIKIEDTVTNRQKEEKSPTVATTEFDMKNFVFRDIPDSLFAVPKEKVIESADAEAR